MSIKCPPAGGGIRTLPFRRGVTVPFPPTPHAHVWGEGPAMYGGRFLSSISRAVDRGGAIGVGARGERGGGVVQAGKI